MHNAIVAKVKRVIEIQGADRIQIAMVLGEAVIVGKDTGVGDIGVFFMPDLQLSKEFCHENNLFRRAADNKDMTKQGFFDTNRRVRAQPFLKIKSCGYFCPLSFFDYTGNTQELVEGFSFDNINGHKICEKFISERTRNAMKQGQSVKKLKLVDTPLFHRHVDTAQFKYSLNSIPVGAVLSFHSKEHGTSARYSHTLVDRKPDYSGLIGWIKKGMDKLRGFEGSTKEWQYVAGTRRVVLFEGQEQKEGYNGPEQWRFDWLEVLKPYLGKGLSVFGEITGYANGKPIMGVHSTAPMKDKAFTKKYGESMTYSYGCNEGQNRFMIYRITQTQEDGTTFDYTPSQVEKWSKDRGLEHTTRVAEDWVYNGDQEYLKDLVGELTERSASMCEDIRDSSHVSEGVVIRVDHEGLTPKFFKQKSYAFSVCEGIYKEDHVDLEDCS